MFCLCFFLTKNVHHLRYTHRKYLSLIHPKDFTMIRTTTLIAGLFLANLAFAADADRTALVSDSEKAVMIATASNTWSMVAMNNNAGLTKVREFHDMGDSGVQQIDYVVNCADSTLALAGFSVLTSVGAVPARSVEPTFAELSFYKPVIQHDQSIANNVCDKRMAMNADSMNK